MPTAVVNQTGRGGAQRASGGDDEKLSLSSILENPHFPAPPALALQIVDKASKPDCNPTEILDLLRRDPGLCGRVFKMVNSSVFGLGRPIASLERAVLVLGIKPLRSLVLGMSLASVQTGKHDELIGQYWRESVGGAVIARDLAVFLKRPDPDDDFLAALLRDLGILVLQQIFPAEYRALWTKCSTGPIAAQCELERASFGIDHAETSSAIMDSWRMPREIALPIRFHHDPERLPDRTKSIQDRTWLLFVASQVARLDGSNPAAVGELLQVARTRFGLDQASLATFLEGVVPKIRDLAEILQVDIGQCPQFSAIVAAGCDELVNLSFEKSRGAAAQNASCDPGQNISVKKPLPSRGGANSRSAAKVREFNIDCLDKSPAAGTVLDGYEIRGIIGRGAMGVVFEAFDPALERTVAIKMLKPERLVSSDARSRFHREAKASASIQHQNVVTIYAVSEFHGLPYIVMEYLEGTSLQQRLDLRQPIPIVDIVNYAHQLATGLGAAHAKKVIHRDIKPDNIVMNPTTGLLKITDFGLARVQDENYLSCEGQLVGTPLYMSPEQFAGGEVDHRADLFGYGSVLYALCAGSPPFMAESVMALMRKVTQSRSVSLKLLRPDVPMWLDSMIAQLHVKQPGQRLASAAEAVRIIETHAGAAVRSRGAAGERSA